MSQAADAYADHPWRANERCQSELVSRALLSARRTLVVGTPNAFRGRLRLKMVVGRPMG